MKQRLVIATIVLSLAAAQTAIPNALATTDPGEQGATPTIAGAAQACRCCITQIGPLGIVQICKQCNYANCACDFDALGLPRCTGNNLE